jgi:ATP-dependent Clp protease ATP-binding subunit ClpA
LRRTIQKYIEDEIAEQFLHGRLSEGSHVKAVMSDGKIVIEPVSDN